MGPIPTNIPNPFNRLIGFQILGEMSIKNDARKTFARV